MALTGCVGEGGTDPAADSEVSQPIESTTTAVASSISTVETDGDAAAAAFTRSLFADLHGDDPGCTVAVGRDGAVVFAEAYGAARLDPFEPMTVDTVVDIASVSKQFTATAILLLAERGAVDLDAPLSTYLPDLPAWASQTDAGTADSSPERDPGLHRPAPRARLRRDGRSPTIADALAALGDVVDLDFDRASRGSTRTRTTSC